MRPEPIQFASPPVLPCPACGEALDDDRDGTSCDQCGGLLVPRVWAERCRPMMGRPVLPPVFVSAPRELPCPACHHALAPVLCHGVAAWSCARCRWLFFEGPRREQLVSDRPAATPVVVKRELKRASLLAVVSERARDARATVTNALGVLVIVAVVVAVVILEGHVL